MAYKDIEKRRANDRRYYENNNSSQVLVKPRRKSGKMQFMREYMRY